MKNIEYYAEDILKIKDIFDSLKFLSKHNIYKVDPDGVPDVGDAIIAFTKWAIKEKPKNALLQWEFDLLIFDKSVRVPFCKIGLFMYMKESGHFKGIEDTSQTLDEILNNYEVIDE